MGFHYFLIHCILDKYFNKYVKVPTNTYFFNVLQEQDRNECPICKSARIARSGNLNVIGAFKTVLRFPVKDSFFLLLVFSQCLLSFTALAQPIACAGEDATICQGEEIQLGCNPSVDGDSYSWFPATGLSCQKCKNPIASPSTTTEYTLTVTDSTGRTSTDIVLIIINPDPVLNTDDVGGRDFKPCTGQLFNLEVWDASEADGININNYRIIWGDGTDDYNSSEPPIMLSHTYDPDENYNLTYEITGSNSCISRIEYRVLNITNPAISTGIPVNAIGCGPKELCFPITGFESNDSSTIYTINFGDGSDTLFNHPPPPEICHFYTKESCTSPGQFFEFEIKASNECDVGIARASPIKIFTKPIPELAIIPGCLNEMTRFVNNTIEGYNSTCSNNTRYIFDFGDGSFDTLNNKNEIDHAYALRGNYNVTLTTENSCGSATFDTTICIGSTPKAAYNLDLLDPCLPFSQVVTQNTTDTMNNCGYVEYLWTIDRQDGYEFRSSGLTTSTAINDTIDFYKSGSYKVNLRYSNACGVSDSSQTIEIKEQIKLTEDNLIGLPDQSCAPYTTKLTTDIIVPDSTGYSWSITGNPAPEQFVPSNLLTPGQINLQPGNYTVELTVFNECGPSDTISKNVSVIEKEIAYAGPDTLICRGEQPIYLKGKPMGGMWSKAGSVPGTWPCLTQEGLFDPACAYIESTDHELVYQIGTGDCESKDTVLVSVIVSPEVEAGTDMVLCRNDPAYNLDLKPDASPSGGFWSGKGIDNNIFDPSKVGFDSIEILYEIVDPATGCSNSDSVTFTVPEITAEAGEDLQICLNNAPFDLNGNKDMAPVGGTWSGNGVNNNIFYPKMAGPGESYLIYTVSNSDSSSSCNATDSIKTIVSTVNVNAGPDVQLCLSSGLFDLNTNPGVMPKGGTWSGSGVSNNIFDPSITGVDTLAIQYTVTDPSSSCTNFDTIFVLVTDVDVNVGTDLEFCITDEPFNLNSIIDLYPKGGTWVGTAVKDGLFEPQLAGAGIFKLDYTYIDQNTQCSNSDSLLAIVYGTPIVWAGHDFELCSYTDVIELNLGQPSGGAWSGPGITDSVKGNFNAWISGTGIHKVGYTYTDKYGCTNSDSIEITVCQDPLKAVQEPTAFTPNGDGLNDTYAPVLDTTAEIVEYWLQIASRDGQVVFETSDSSARWDGIYRGNEIFGVCGYKLHVKFISGLTIDHVGEILVIR